MKHILLITTLLMLSLSPLKLEANTQDIRVSNTIGAKANSTPVSANYHVQEIAALPNLSEMSNAITVMAWRPKHDEIAVVYAEDASLKIINVQMGKIVFDLDHGSLAGYIDAVEWSSDGNYLAAAVRNSEIANVSNTDSRVAIWHFNEATMPQRTILHYAGVRNSLTWSSDNKLYRTAAYAFDENDWRLIVWDSATNTLNELFRIDAKNLTVTASPKGNLIATFMEIDHVFTLQIRDSTGTIKLRMPTLPDNLKLLGNPVWNADGTLLYGAGCQLVEGGCMLWRWELENNQLTFPFQRGNDIYDVNIGTADLALSYDGKLLATSDISFNRYLWDTTTGKVIPSPSTNDLFVTAITWDTEQLKLAVALYDATIHIWQVTEQ